jgi:hypothetical protein
MKTAHAVLFGAPLIALSLFSGCSSDSETPQGGTQNATASGAGGAGGDGGAGGAPCEAGSHPGPNGCESTLASWSDGPPLAEKRDHHATFVAESDAGAFLYVLGGVRDMNTLLSSAEAAPLGADGSVGAWAPATTLPETMAGHMVAVVDRTVIVTGGYRAGPSLSNKTEYAEIGADGRIGLWADGPTLAATRFHHAMIAVKGSLYVAGGLTGNNTDNTTLVERSVVSAGSVGAWSQLTPLPQKRSHHSLATDGTALFVTAGLTGDPAGVHTDFKDVLRAPILEDGTIGDWATVGQLPATLGTHASFVHLGYLYVAGGVESNLVNTPRVRRAQIGAEGKLGVWEDVAEMPIGRAHCHHTPVHGAFVYAVGGAVNHASTAEVFIGHFE